MSALLIAVAPALPLHSAGKYVAGAYIVFVAVILIYVAIMAVRLTRNQREIAELKAELDRRSQERDGDDTTAPELEGSVR
jgi:Na+/melibiose symporter-like transporter